MSNWQKLLLALGCVAFTIALIIVGATVIFG
jgi:hypothetical protein